MPEYRSQQATEPNSGQHLPVAATVLLLLIGFIAGAAVINIVVTQKYWRPDLGAYSARMAALEQISDSVTSIFVGSSHILGAINPTAYDAVRSQQGSAELSFNMGEFGALMPVQQRTLQHLAQLQPPKLRYVFFEPMLFDVPVAPATDALLENLLSTRVRYYYDLTTSWRCLQLRWFSDRTLGSKLLGTAAIAAAWTFHAVNLGVIRDVLSPPPDRSASIERAVMVRGNVVVPRNIEARANLQPPDEHNGYRKISTNELQLLDEFVDLMRQTGAQPILLFPPARIALGRQRAIRDAVLGRYPDILVMDYTFDTRPLDLYFEPRLWADADHLTTLGSNKFSEILASDLLLLEQAGKNQQL